MPVSIQTTLLNLTIRALITSLSLISLNGVSAELPKSAFLPLELAQTTAPTNEGCKDDGLNCDKISLLHERNDMSTYTRYRGAVDWNNAYRRFGYGDSLNFQKVTELEWQQEGSGGRSFDVFKKDPEDTSVPKDL